MEEAVYDIARSRKDSDRSQPVVIIESPHAGKAVPRGFPRRISRALLKSHDGWDPGASKLQGALRKRFMWRANARFITSRISRQVVDHNRTKRFTCQPGLSREDRRFYIDNFHAPYIGAVFGEINGAIADKKFPIIFNIHTYEPYLNGGRRKLFSISGNPDSVIVQAFQKYMQAELSKPATKRNLEVLRLSPDNFLHDLNEPYNLGPLEKDKKQPGKFRKNPLRVKNMAMRYAKNYGFPWVHLETRNDMAHEPVVQNIVVNVIEAVLNDKDVQADWQKRRDQYFNAKPGNVSRPVPRHPLGKPQFLRAAA